MENLSSFQVLNALQNVNKDGTEIEDLEGSVSAPASLHFTKRGLASAAFTSRMESDEESEANADKYIEISRLRPRSHIIDMSGSQLRKMTLNPVSSIRNVCLKNPSFILKVRKPLNYMFSIISKKSKKSILSISSIKYMNFLFQ